MSARSRRRFVSDVALAGAAVLAPRAAAAAAPAGARLAAARDERVPLDGVWEFRLDAAKIGDRDGWHRPGAAPGGWASVTVPHTWQTQPASADYYGAAWYRRRFAAPLAWQGQTVRLEFQSVFHSASVWVNGTSVGEHLRKGYTAFTLDITSALRWDEPNTVVVRADNAFDDEMLPRGRSSDWTHDGGIYRPVALVVSPPVFIDRLAVDGVPVGAWGATTAAEIHLAVTVRNTTKSAVRGSVSYDVVDRGTGEVALRQPRAGQVSVPAGQSVTIDLAPGSLPDARLWHFDHPHLYTVRVTVEPPAGPSHQIDDTFGIRLFEARDGGLFPVNYLHPRRHPARVRERVRCRRRHHHRHGLRDVAPPGGRLADAHRRVHRGASARRHGDRGGDRGGGGAGPAARENERGRKRERGGAKVREIVGDVPAVRVGRRADAARSDDRTLGDGAARRSPRAASR